MTKREMQKEGYNRIIMEIGKLDHAKDLEFLEWQSYRIFGVIRFSLHVGIINKDDYNELRRKSDYFYFKNLDRLEKTA